MFGSRLPVRLDDLGPLGQPVILTPNRDQRRRLVRIVVIDDSEFGALAELRHQGFQIDEMPDYAGPVSISNYDAVLCDLHGVGTARDKILQGAAAIRDIKENYPQKTVAAYTAAAGDSLVAFAARSFADHYISKNATTEEWVTLLDQIVVTALDPIVAWKRVRLSLLQRGATLQELIEAEEAFVTTVQRKQRSATALQSYVDARSLADDLKSIVLSLIASAIFAQF